VMPRREGALSHRKALIRTLKAGHPQIPKINADLEAVSSSAKICAICGSILWRLDI